MKMSRNREESKNKRKGPRQNQGKLPKRKSAGRSQDIITSPTENYNLNRGPKYTSADVERLIHDLSVHQIELETQNEELRRIQLELKEAKNKYAELYNFAPVGYLTLNEKCTILEANFTACQMLDIEKQNLIKRNFSRYIRQEDSYMFYSYRKRLIDTGTRQVCKLRIRKNNGAQFYAQLEGTATFDDQGKFSHFKIAMVDITQRRRAEEVLLKAHDKLESVLHEQSSELVKTKETLQSEVIQRAKTEEALREREEEYKKLFDDIPIGIYRTTPDGRILKANPALVHMLGYSSFDELASHNLEEPGFQPNYDRNKFKELLKNQNEVMGFESVWTKKDGTSLFVRESARAVKGKDGTTLYYEGTVEDITERKQAEDRFRQAVESAPNAIVMVNQQGIITFVNSQTERLFGYSKDELIGQSVEILVPERLRSNHSKFRLEFYGDPRARPMGAGRDLFALRKDGSEFPVEIGLNPVHTADGIIVLGSIVDITQRKRAELELRKEKDKAQKYLDIAEVIIVAINHKEEVTLINQKGCDLLGYEEEDIIGKNWFEFFLPNKIREEARKIFQNIIKGRVESYKYYENPVLTKSGKERLIAWHNTVLTDEDGNIIGTLSSGEDITERRQAEEALRESEQKLKAIMDNTTDAILVYDEDGRIITINKKGENLFSGGSKKRLESIWDTIPSEERIKFSERLKSVKEGNKLLDYETQKVLGNGERIPVSVGLVYVADGVSWFIETVRDVRERVALRNKIIELEKAQIVGRMAEGIAHHMGTPLASMLLRVQMLKEDAPSAFEYEKYLEKLDSIERQIFYTQKVIQRLLKFVSKPENEKSLDNVSNILDDAAEITNPLFKKRGIKLELKVDEDLYVLADSNLLGLVFVDIMMNALDAMPEGGKLSVIASLRKPEGLIEIRISDTGSGIPRDVLPFVFEPFFTTKPAGKGTGLGLSVAKRIIHDHGGEISIDSTEGKGTSVIIKLPAQAEGKEIEQA